MGKLHISNTFFEREASGQKGASLIEMTRINPIFSQLQYLPLLYASPEDQLLVTDPLPDSYHFPFREQPKALTFDDPLPKGTHIESWGPSLLIEQFAKERGLLYEMPPWEVVQKVSSKRFSHSLCPLPGSELLETPSDLSRFPKNWVFKSLHGTAGRGRSFSSDPQLESFAQKEWAKGNALLAEPWCDRLLDFSTQWMIEKTGEITHLGTTECLVGPRGQHIGNIAPASIEGIEEHHGASRAALAEMARLGFFGPVGIDAFSYRSEGKRLLHPIVEINPRKTMGWVALAIQERHFPDQAITLSYHKTDQAGLLPPSKKQYQLTISPATPPPVELKIYN